jgi:ribosome-binding protein aMBF1 (putative translation factor)
MAIRDDITRCSFCGRPGTPSRRIVTNEEKSLSICEECMLTGLEILEGDDIQDEYDRGYAGYDNYADVGENEINL